MSSLEALEDVVRREYDAQERRADSLDTKAGLVLGFAGLLVSLTPSSVWAPLALVARVLAGAAGALALRVFAVSPRTAPSLDDFPHQDVTEVRHELVAVMVSSHGLLSHEIDTKTRRIRAALRLLTFALGTIGTGTAVDAVRNLVR